MHYLATNLYKTGLLRIVSLVNISVKDVVLKIYFGVIVTRLFIHITESQSTYSWSMFLGLIHPLVNYTSPKILFSLNVICLYSKSNYNLCVMFSVNVVNQCYIMQKCIYLCFTVYI